MLVLSQCMFGLGGLWAKFDVRLDFYMLEEIPLKIQNIMSHHKVFSRYCVCKANVNNIFWGLLLTFSPVLPKQGRRYVWPQRSPSTPTEVSAWKAEEVFLSVSQFLCSTRNLWPLVFNTSSSSFSKGMPHHPHHHHNPPIIYFPNWHHHHLNISTKKILTQCKFAN